MGLKMQVAPLCPLVSVPDIMMQWTTFLEISEDDFEQLGVKRGHRRLLQKEIEKYKREHHYDSGSSATPLPSGSSHEASSENVTPPDEEPTTPPKTKRRYRWHPRPDPNAPKRPKTAYVRFADQLRQDPSVMSMSFVEIAKEVGWRWQKMEPGVKQKFELDAAQEMQDYEDQMRAYKQTPVHREYQEYLDRFRKAPSKPSRPKLKNQPRYEKPVSSRPSSGTSQGTGFFLVSSPSSQSAAPQEFRQLLAYSLADFRRLASESHAKHVFDQSRTPPEQFSKPASEAVVNGVGSFMFIWGRDEIAALFRRTYSTLPVDPLSMCELYAVSALGGHYCGELIPAQSARGMMATSISLLDDLDIDGAEPNRVMRLLATFSVLAILEKHLSCKALVGESHRILRLTSMLMYPTATGVSLGRLMMSKQGEFSDTEVNKIYRTLITMSWYACRISILTFTDNP
jgi:hypothetical protein